jgi:hypothetical protein
MPYLCGTVSDLASVALDVGPLLSPLSAGTNRAEWRTRERVLAVRGWGVVVDLNEVEVHSSTRDASLSDQYLASTYTNPHPRCHDMAPHFHLMDWEGDCTYLELESKRLHLTPSGMLPSKSPSPPARASRLPLPNEGDESHSLLCSPLKGPPEIALV